jgi:hypothetical protein
MAKNKKHKGKGKHHKGVAELLQPGKTQSGKSLLRLAKAMTRLQIKPQVKAYKRLAAELRGQQAAQIGGTARLGRVLGGQLAQAYKGFDAGANQSMINAAALGQMGQGQANRIGAQQAAELKSYQTGQLGGLEESMRLRGAPGGGLAQQQLRDLVAGQQQRLAASNAANSAFAAQQGNAYTGLAQGIQQAGRLQGATAQNMLAKTIASQIGQIRLETGADIREAMGKLADVKALEGSQLIATLGQLTKDERDYILGLKATKIDQGQLALDQQEAAEAARHNRATEHQAAQDSGGGGGDGGGGGRPRHKPGARDIQSQIRGLIARHGRPRNASERADIIDAITGGYSSARVRRILNRILQNK